MKALTSASSRRRGRSRAGQKATIYEVAERAGVSIATVSRVLRGTVPVASETRQRVIEAIEQLRYTPSRLGRGLAERQHAANGIVFPDLSGPYYAEVVLGYESVTAELGRSVIILSTSGRAAPDDLVVDLASRVDGLVVFGRTVDNRVVRQIIETGLPVVLLARPPIPGADAVNTENQASAANLAEHLLGHGHQRFVFLGDPEASSDFAERWTGLTLALERRGAAPPTRVTCGFDEEAGEVAADRLLRHRHRPDVLVCGNDQVALGALAAARRTGLTVPDEVAITGWDDIMAARHAYPALTTVRQPMRELGARAAHALDERLSGSRTEPHHEVLPTQLVVRASCGRHERIPEEEQP